MSYRITISIVQKDTNAPIGEFDIGFNQLFFRVDWEAVINEHGKIEGNGKVIIKLKDYNDAIQSIEFSRNVDNVHHCFTKQHFDNVIDYCNEIKDNGIYFISIY